MGPSPKENTTLQDSFKEPRCPTSVVSCTLTLSLKGDTRQLIFFFHIYGGCLSSRHFSPAASASLNEAVPAVGRNPGVALHCRRTAASEFHSTCPNKHSVCLGPCEAAEHPQDNSVTGTKGAAAYCICSRKTHFNQVSRVCVCVYGRDLTRGGRGGPADTQGWELGLEEAELDFCHDFYL